MPRRPRDATGPEGGRKGRTRTYLVLWWLDQAPQVARVDDIVEAEAAAKQRNATLIEIRGREVEVTRVLDYWRRDEVGRPMPAKWKELRQPVFWPFPLAMPRGQRGLSATEP